MKTLRNTVITLVVVIALMSCSKESPVSNTSTETPASTLASTSSEYSEDNAEEPEVLVLPVIDVGSRKSAFGAHIDGYSAETYIKSISLKPASCLLLTSDATFDGKTPFVLENGKRASIISSNCLTTDVKEVVVETSNGSFSTPVVLQ